MNPNLKQICANIQQILFNIEYLYKELFCLLVGSQSFPKLLYSHVYECKVLAYKNFKKKHHMQAEPLSKKATPPPARFCGTGVERG